MVTAELTNSEIDYRRLKPRFFDGDQNASRTIETLLKRGAAFGDSSSGNAPLALQTAIQRLLSSQKNVSAAEIRAWAQAQATQRKEIFLKPDRSGRFQNCECSEC